jgi:hypothetical protein
MAETMDDVCLSGIVLNENNVWDVSAAWITHSKNRNIKLVNKDYL